MDKLGLTNKLKAIKLSSNTDEILGIDKLRNKENEKIQDILISKIREFKNHPFRVCAGVQFDELIESIKTNGVLNPAIVRKVEPDENGCEYEMISGHRRKKASEIAGLETIPCIIRDLDDDQSTIIMVDSNMQRENILPSEKAFAYKMKLEAIKRQGQRTDLTSRQLGEKSEGGLTSRQLGEKSEDGLTSRQLGERSENDLTSRQLGEKSENDLTSRQFGEKLEGNLTSRQPVERLESADIIGRDTGESGRQVQRYIRLTYLIPSILKMVDEKQIAFNPAVELSYIDEKEQQMLDLVLKENKYKVDQNKATMLRENSGRLNIELLTNIISGDKESRTNKPRPLKIKPAVISKYFRSNETKEEIEDIIEKALDNYFSTIKNE